MLLESPPFFCVIYLASKLHRERLIEASICFYTVTAMSLPNYIGWMKQRRGSNHCPCSVFRSHRRATLRLLRIVKMKSYWLFYMGHQVLPTLFHGQKLFLYDKSAFCKQNFNFVSDEISSVDEIEFRLGRNLFCQ